MSTLNIILALAGLAGWGLAVCCVVFAARWMRVAAEACDDGRKTAQLATSALNDVARLENHVHRLAEERDEAKRKLAWRTDAHDADGRALFRALDAKRKAETERDEARSMLAELTRQNADLMQQRDDAHVAVAHMEAIEENATRAADALDEQIRAAHEAFDARLDELRDQEAEAVLLTADAPAHRAPSCCVECRHVAEDGPVPVVEGIGACSYRGACACHDEPRGEDLRPMGADHG